MHGFKMSLVHYPIHRAKIRRSHYRLCLGFFTLAILVVHYYKPELEPHIAAMTNILFIVDPTV